MCGLSISRAQAGFLLSGRRGSARGEGDWWFCGKLPPGGRSSTARGCSGRGDRRWRSGAKTEGEFVGAYVSVARGEGQRREEEEQPWRPHFLCISCVANWRLPFFRGLWTFSVHWLGKNDPSIPEEDGLEVTTPQSDDKSKTNDYSRKPHFTLSNWRDVRANLVAKEQEHLLDTDGLSITSSQQPQMLGSKWAHPIPMLETGCVLLATEKLDGVPMFERTVILIINLGSRDPRDRPFGVILNRPLRRKIKHMNPSNTHLATIFSNCSVHCGGPVEANMFLLKSIDNLPLPGLGEAVPGVYFGSRNNLDDAAALVEKGAFMPQDFVFFEGYSGWEFDQLLDELESEYWVVASCSSHLIHQVSETWSNLWEEVLQLMGGQYSELSRRPKQDDT